MSGSTLKTAGNLLKGLKKVGDLKKGETKVSKNVSVNKEGEIKLGVSSKGVGVSISNKGNLSVGIGVVSTTINLKNPNNSKIGIGFDTMTIEGKQVGCTVILSYKILGVTVNTETRIVPDCKKKEPISKPDPKDDEDIKKSDTGVPPRPSGRDPVPYPLVPGKTYGIMYESSSFYDGSAIEDVEWVNAGRYYWFMPSAAYPTPETVGSLIVPIINRLPGETKIAFYEILGTAWTFAPWIRKDTPVYTVPSGQPNAGTKYLGGNEAWYWLENTGGSAFEPNYFIPNHLTRAYYVWNGEGWDVRIDNFPVRPSDRTKWFPGTPNAKIVEVPPLKPRPKTNTPTRTPMSDDCCEEIKEMINEFYDVIRPDKFAFKLPESFRTIDGNEPKNKDIDDYPEAFGYLLDRIDELIGQFNIDIEIEDTDPVTQGNQTAKISIGNISEGIAEIIGLIYGLGISQKIGTEASVKSLITLGMVQRTITEIDAVTEEIFDHLEIPMKEVEREIDLEFSPGVKNFDAFFKPSKERVKVPERLQGKNAPTLQDQLDILIQAATIIKSRGFKKVNPYQDIGAQVVGNLASGLLDKYVLNNSEDPNKTPDPNKKSDFDDFIDDVQENFKKYEKPGEVDLEKSDNPKIIKLEKPGEPTPKPPTP